MRNLTKLLYFLLKNNDIKLLYLEDTLEEIYFDVFDYYLYYILKYKKLEKYKSLWV